VAETAGKLMSLTEEQVDALPQFYMVEDKRTAKLGTGADTVRITVDPQMMGRPTSKRRISSSCR